MTRYHSRRNIPRVTHKSTNKRTSMRDNPIHYFRSILFHLVHLSIFPQKIIPHSRTRINLTTNRYLSMIMFPLFTSMHFVGKFTKVAACSSTAYEVVSDCRKSEKTSIVVRIQQSRCNAFRGSSSLHFELCDPVGKTEVAITGYSSWYRWNIKPVNTIMTTNHLKNGVESTIETSCRNVSNIPQTTYNIILA
jgi:hypothetical protein